MGLCKCPKRKVTNQFCFEHRVNVCEHCIVQNHPKCVVQSYLQWLQDSDYNPNCHFCDQELAEEACVRLACYHVFHWVCVDKWARSMPALTAPAGYTCPTCQECIFPPEKLASPVADALRKVLSDVNWARAGLNLPLLEDRIERKPQFSDVPSGPRPAPEGESITSMSAMTDGRPGALPVPKKETHIQFDSGDGTPTSRTVSAKYGVTSMTPLLNSPQSQSSDADLDENKYKRRSAITWLSRWWRSMMGPKSGRRRATKSQKIFMGVVIAFFVFVTLVALFSFFGRSGDYNDPMLDPMNNPNIRVGVESK